MFSFIQFSRFLAMSSYLDKQYQQMVARGEITATLVAVKFACFFATLFPAEADDEAYCTVVCL